MIKVKLLWNWSDSESLTEEFSNMCDHMSRKYKNLELVTTEKADYYVIINHPRSGDYFEPEKTIVIHGEPWCRNDCQDWPEPGTAPEKFLSFNSSDRALNLVQWQMRISPEDLSRDISESSKTKQLSSIVSSLYSYPGHRKRIDFIKYLESKKFEIDIYGRSNDHNFKNYIKKLVNKEEGYFPYKYYFMAENTKKYNYITEKMWEPLLSECFVFYWGTPNVSDYVDPRCFIRLELEDFEKDYKIISDAIADNVWEKSLPYIREAKKKILNEYAFFPKIRSIIHMNEGMLTE